MGYAGLPRRIVLLSEEVAEVDDGVLGVANEEGLGLGTVVFVAIDV